MDTPIPCPQGGVHCHQESPALSKWGRGHQSGNFWAVPSPYMKDSFGVYRAHPHLPSQFQSQNKSKHSSLHFYT